MTVRSLLVLTAGISSVLGALVVYLVLTVPNDLQADALLKSARADIAAGRNDTARSTLARLIQQYPRTDGAAAATVALLKLADGDRVRLARDLHQEVDTQKKQLDDLTRKIGEAAAQQPVEAAAIPAIGTPVTATVTPAAPAKPAVKPAVRRRVRRARRRHR